MKKLILYGTLGYGAYWLFTKGSKTYNTYKKALEQVTAKFKKVENVKIKDGKINLKAKIEIINGSDKELGLNTGGNIILKKLRFYTKSGGYIATAIPNISAIKIPAHGSVFFQGIPVNIPLKDIGGLIKNALDIVQDINNLDVEMDIDVFGHTITI